jgi:hypothetical protein
MTKLDIISLLSLERIDAPFLKDIEHNYKTHTVTYLEAL